MASVADTAATDDAEAPPRDPARDHLRDLIREQVAARRPRPLARRTVELLTESALEPAPGVPAYRVVDRQGEPRLREVDGAPAEPLTLADLLAELEARHPALFEPPLPEAEPLPAAGTQVAKEGSRPGEAAASQAVKLRDDAARYIELQSAKARVVSRAVAVRSSARGRTLAASAGATYAALRAKAADLTNRAPGRSGAEPNVAPDPAPASAAAPTVPLGDRLRGKTGDVLARWRDALGRANDLLDGRWILGSATAAAVLIAAVVLITTARDGADAPGEAPSAKEGSKDGSKDAAASAPAGTQPGAAQSSPPPSNADPAPEAAPPGSAQQGQEAQVSGATPPPEDESELPPPAPGDLSGPAEVVDTATLKLGGRVLRLFGVEWVRGGNPQDLTRYLAGRPVSCQRAPGSETYLCQVEGRDLSEVVLFNGGGRASPEANPDLVAAEDHARTERLGVWKR